MSEWLLRAQRTDSSRVHDARPFAVSMLANQSVSALIWGTILGALFGVALTGVAARWPSVQLFGPRRLRWIGAVVGLGLGASIVRVG